MGNRGDHLVMNDFLGQLDSEKGPVECFGQTFPNADARREHFLNLLAEKLEDPAFRNQEGFPRSGGSPAAPDGLRKRFESFLNERCKGKATSKLRFVVE